MGYEIVDPIQSGHSPGEEAWAGERAQLEGLDFGIVISHVVEGEGGGRRRRKGERRGGITEAYNGCGIKAKRTSVGVRNRQGDESSGNLRINRLLRRLVSSSGVPCTGTD